MLLNPTYLLPISLSEHMADLVQLALLFWVIFLQLVMLLLQLTQLRLDTDQLAVTINQIENILLIVTDLGQTISQIVVCFSEGSLSFWALCDLNLKKLDFPPHDVFFLFVDVPWKISYVYVLLLHNDYKLRIYRRCQPCSKWSRLMPLNTRLSLTSSFFFSPFLPNLLWLLGCLSYSNLLFFHSSIYFFNFGCSTSSLSFNGFLLKGSLSSFSRCLCMYILSTTLLLVGRRTGSFSS